MRKVQKASKPKPRRKKKIVIKGTIKPRKKPPAPRTKPKKKTKAEIQDVDAAFNLLVKKVAKAADRSGLELNDFVACPAEMEKAGIDPTKVDHAVIRHAREFLLEWDGRIRRRVSRLNNKRSQQHDPVD